MGDGCPAETNPAIRSKAATVSAIFFQLDWLILVFMRMQFSFKHSSCAKVAHNVRDASGKRFN